GIGGTSFPLQESGQHIEVIQPNCLVDVLVRAGNLESSVNQGSCRRLNLPQPLILSLQLLDAAQQRLVLLAVAGRLGTGSAKIALHEFERQACTALPCAVQVRRNGLLRENIGPAERAPLWHVRHGWHLLLPSRERPAYRSDPPALLTETSPGSPWALARGEEWR